MTPEQIAEVLPRLEEFAAEVFADFGRADQREKGTLYLRGLMTDGKRKSMQPMAERLGIDHQGLQQFITSSTWDYTEVRRSLALRMFDEIKPEAYAVDDVGFPKDGSMSPGVAAQYCGALGKVGNCQIGVSVQLVTDHASVAANWRLFLPESWDDHLTPKAETEQQARDLLARARLRRERCRIPDAVRHRTKPQLALDQLEQMTGPAGWGLPRLPVVADCAYGDNTAFRLALAARGFAYALAVGSDLSVQPGDAIPAEIGYTGLGRRPRPQYPDKPVSVKTLAISAGRAAYTQVTWRNGSRVTRENPDAAMSGKFLAMPVRPANKAVPRGPDGALPTEVLLAQWDDDVEEPTDYWLTSLPADTPLPTLVRLAKIRWRIEHDYRELKHGLGLDHFEGRSYAGWHRHVTLTTAAQAFCTLLRGDPKAPAPA
jgi:SRSO17 transposase